MRCISAGFKSLNFWKLVTGLLSLKMHFLPFRRSTYIFEACLLHLRVAKGSLPIAVMKNASHLWPKSPAIHNFFICNSQISAAYMHCLHSSPEFIVTPESSLACLLCRFGEEFTALLHVLLVLSLEAIQLNDLLVFCLKALGSSHLRKCSWKLCTEMLEYFWIVLIYFPF